MKYSLTEHSCLSMFGHTPLLHSLQSLATTTGKQRFKINIKKNKNKKQNSQIFRIKIQSATHTQVILQNLRHLINLCKYSCIVNQYVYNKHRYGNHNSKSHYLCHLK